MPFAAARSEHPVASHATGEVLGEVLDRVGTEPDVAVVFATAAYGGAFDDITGAIHQVLRPSALIGCVAPSVVAGASEIEDHPALVLWAGRSGVLRPSGGGSARAVHLRAPVGDGAAVEGLPADVAEGSTLVVLADLFSFPGDTLLASLRSHAPELSATGGLVAGARSRGGNRIAVDRRVVHEGAAALVLPPGAVDALVVSQGCTPIGDPWIVTKAERGVLYELGGRPALDRLMEIVDSLDADRRRAAAQGLHLGIVVDESRPEHRRGDFLVRTVLGADRSVGAVAVDEVAEVGRTVQFHVRDAESADADLRALLAGADADAALLFTCVARGTQLFGEPHHDAALVEAVAGPATAGMFSGGELGPVGGRPFLHTHTASVALFRDGP